MGNTVSTGSAGRPGTKVAASPYVVEETLASGGMGVVYRVRERVTGEARALKRIIRGGTERDYFVRAFEREYQVLASLKHPRIIRVFDYGVDETGPYYTMELLEGADLRKSSPLPVAKACLYLRDIATSLSLLHARRLIHRDLSPSNVRTTQDGHCKLLDFGALVAFGRPEHVVGTPPLIPPEALNDSPLDQRADLYSLGALAYFLLTGRHAFRAREIPELFSAWKEAPPSPSSLAPGIPEDLDALVLSLLRADPRARPASAAEVIARLTVIGELPPLETTEAEQLAQSFLASPRFVGRATELGELRRSAGAVAAGRGDAICIDAAAGMGRTRLLDEVGIEAKLAGAVVIRTDASLHGKPYGTARALVLRLFEALPDAAEAAAGPFRSALAALGRDWSSHLGRPSIPSRSSDSELRDAPRPLEDWFAEVAVVRPLVIAVDNVEEADDASTGMLARLARSTATRPILLVVTERLGGKEKQSRSIAALRAQTRHVGLSGLSAAEMLELTRSLFGDAPNVERFASWLHGRTAGSPLHAIEVSRRLIAEDVIRHAGGLFILPEERPDAELPAALGEVLSARLAQLGEPARALAESLSLARESPSLRLCCLLSGADERTTYGLLDELARADVVYPEGDTYRFTSTAVRDALLAGIDALGLKRNHRRLGDALTKLVGEGDPALGITAGWHLIRGGDETRGADMIAVATHDSQTIRNLFGNLLYTGAALEAALEVYQRNHRSIYARMPLLSGLAQAGYYEARSWGERHGDQALETLEDISGLRAARRLRRFCGRRLGLLLGLAIAFLRFSLVRRKERPYSFLQLLVHLFSTVTSLAGTASLSLDSVRTERVADVLEPFSVLPETATPVGVYRFCVALGEIGRDDEARAYEAFDDLLRKFQDPAYYRTLPPDGRALYVAGTHFARASVALFRADGRGALESTEALDCTGFELYRMIASQLRFLYYMNRGEFPKAAPHREQVEHFAAQIGSIWQVETWEAAALVLVNNAVGDIVGSTRVAHRLELLAETVPSLKFHAQLAKDVLSLNLRDKSYLNRVTEEYRSFPPRSFVGWGNTMGCLAKGYNEQGFHAEAKSVCAYALSYLGDADREYVTHFLFLDLELAVADAGLGLPADAFQRIDGLLERYGASRHPLALGLIYETRARIAWGTGDEREYDSCLAQARLWFESTETPQLIARVERLAELRTSRLRHPVEVSAEGDGEDGQSDADAATSVEI